MTRSLLKLLFLGASLLYGGCEELGNSGPWDDPTPTDTLAPSPSDTPCCPTFTPTFTMTPGRTPTPTETATNTFEETPLPERALVINELMAQNDRCLADSDGDTSDWIEIFNPSDVSINLGGMGLSDDLEDGEIWVLPSVILPPLGHLVIFASGKDRVGEELHASFKLSAEGESVRLIRRDGSTADSLTFTALGEDVALGRAPDGSGRWRTFECGSPGSENPEDGVLLQAPIPEPSIEDGLLAGPTTVSFEVPEGVEIYYTLDGSIPGPDSPLYTGPISIGSRVGDANEHAQLPTNHIVNDGWAYEWKAPGGEVPKATILRARSFQNERAPSPILTQTYIVDPPISGALTLPIVSVVAEPEALFSYEEGIYLPGIAWDEGEAAGYSGADSSHPANYHWRGIDYERPAHLSFFEPEGEALVSVDVGLRIHGNTSRAYPFKSLRFYLRDEYGQDKVDEDLFASGEDLDFHRILLRNSGGDYGGTLFKDALNQRLLMGHTALDLANYRPTALYLNGEYWGIHNLRDRLDDDWLAERYDLDKDAIVILEDEGSLDTGTSEDVAGYAAFMDFVEASDLNDPEVWAEIERQIDVDNFIDYHILQIFVLNQDWPHSNQKFWRHRVEPIAGAPPSPGDGRWRYGVFDTDHSLWDPAADNLARLLDPGHRLASSTELFRGMNENEGFQERFLLRFADLLNGPLRPEAALPIINEMSDRIAPYMPLQILRWQYPGSYNGWENKIDSLRTFMTERPGYLFGYLLDHYDVSETAPLSVSVEGPGEVRIGSVTLRETSGSRVLTEFVGLDVGLQAVADEGAEVEGWTLDGADGGEGEAVTLTIAPGGNAVLCRFEGD